MSAAAVGFAPVNPMLVESDFEHRAAVDCLKWQLGQPLSWLPPPLSVPDWPPVGLPRPYRYYDDYYYYCGRPPFPGDRLDRANYSQGFRDGLAAFARGESGGKAAAPSSSAGGQASSTTIASKSTSAGGAKGTTPAAASYPGDLMEFPSASYRRPVGPVPLSNCTSYDDLTLSWPYGCKPFYYRRADPPSVRYC